MRRPGPWCFIRRRCWRAPGSTAMAAFLVLLLLLGTSGEQHPGPGRGGRQDERGAGAEVAPGPLESLTQVELLELQPLQQEPALLLPVTLQQEQEPPLVLPPRWGSNLATFPPARPRDGADIAQLCRHPPAAPVPLAELPRGGFSHLRRQAQALGHLRRRLRRCCRQPQPLPCAQQAWVEVLDGFCEDEFGVKTRHYRCCLWRGAERQRCFEEAARGASAEESSLPPPLPPLPTPLAFPPGEPTAANMGNICRLRRFRTATVPPPGLGSRARALAHLEHDYKGCCSDGGRGDLACAHDAWRRTLERFCQEEGSVKRRLPRCCRGAVGRARERCFAAEAPQPAYARELRRGGLAPLLGALCSHARLLTKRRPVPALVQNVTAACCPHAAGTAWVACTEDEISRSVAVLCSSLHGSWKDPEHCCDADDAAGRRRCFDSRYLAHLEVASSSPELLPPDQDKEPAQP